jgi:hypothetical protein
VVIIPFVFMNYGLIIWTIFYILFYLFVQNINDKIIGRFFIKLESQYFFKHFSKWLFYNFKYLLSIFYFKSFSQKIFEFIILTFKFCVKITPRKLIFIKQKNHYINQWLNIISSAFIISSTAIQTCIKKIARKPFNIFFLNMLIIFIQISTSKTKIN